MKTTNNRLNALLVGTILAAATKAVKVPNYTPEQTAKVLADYANGITPDKIGEALGKSVRSIVAKLSREGVYKPKAYTTKTGEVVVKKDECADKIAAMLNLNEADADSLTKANKSALKAIVAALEEAATLTPVTGVFEDETATIDTEAHTE